MTKFIFLRGYVGTLNVMDGQTFATASLYNPNTFWTPEESERQRELRMELGQYFRGPMEQITNHGIISQEQYMRNRDMLIEQERIRRLEMINHSRQTDEQIRLFQATTTITVNPTLWTKVKIFRTGVKLVLKESWKADPIGVIVVTLLSSVVTFIGIMKLFGA
jgi:hypothetical protein